MAPTDTGHLRHSWEGVPGLEEEFPQGASSATRGDAAEEAGTPQPGEGEFGVGAPDSAAGAGAHGCSAPDPERTPQRESGRARQRRQREAEEQDTPMYRLKVEGARSLGLWEKVQAVGWGGLSAAESGRVGGYITRILRTQRHDESADTARPAGGG